jgi:integrase
VWDPTRPASSSWIRRQWNELRSAAGLPWLTPHCFRHQHITLRIESGDPIEIVAKDVGHSAPAMTRYYTHTRRERQKVSVDAIDPLRRFGPLPAGVPWQKKVTGK